MVAVASELGIRQQLTIFDGDVGFKSVSDVVSKINAASTDFFSLIWQRSVLPQTIEAWGFGDPALPTNQGYATFAAAVKAASGEYYEGVLRFLVTNAPTTREVFQRQLASSGMHSNESLSATVGAEASLFTDRQNMLPFPEGDAEARQDSKLQIWYRAQIEPTADCNDVAFRIDGTLWA